MLIDPVPSRLLSVHGVDLGQVLPQSQLFKGIGLEVIGYLLPACEVMELQAGTVLLSNDAPNDSVYVLLSGGLCVHLLPPSEGAIANIAVGGCAGEMSVIDGEPTSAAVTAQARSLVLRIPQDVLWSMVNASHGVARNLLYILSTRMRVDNQLIVQSLHAQRQSEHAALVDPLTGLHNRRWMTEAFVRQITRCREDAQPLCVVMVDVDHFKRINDTWGHLAGDQALEAMAAVLANNIRPMDLLARFGGEEFALGLPNTSLDAAFAIAERVRRAVEFLALPFRRSEPLPHLTVSLGVSSMQDGQTLDDMVALADAALYRAKEGGRNRVAI